MLRFITTIRYLKWQQIVGQVLFRLKPFFQRIRPGVHLAVPEFPGCHWKLKTPSLAPVPRQNGQENIKAGRFRFLNVEKTVGFPPDWQMQDVSRLWLYNLHYFDYLWYLDYDSARKLALDWLAVYQQEHNRPGWQAYPISLRLLNWCGVFFGKFRAETQQDAAFRDELWRSIFRQVEWLSRNTEIHLLGNHLLENAAALAVVGACFTSGPAGRWFGQGLKILERELPRQISSDGMHCELSPMYHCRVLYLLACLYNIDDARLNRLVGGYLEKMLAALQYLLHPDGGIALLNDSAFGIYISPAALTEWARILLPDYAVKIPSSVFALPQSGYYGSRSPAGNYIICDMAAIGPDYIPGHAHADIFTYELSLRGKRVIVDAGVYDYEISPLRDYCRSTRAHNTVEIEGQDQCQMWAAFRVARRGYPHDIRWQARKNGFCLSGWHDGYRRLYGKPVHFRQFDWDDGGELAIADRVQSRLPVQCISRVHLHPDCEIGRLTHNSVAVDFAEGEFVIDFTGEGELQVQDSLYCPEFGLKINNKTLAFASRGTDTRIGYTIRLKG